MTHSVLSRSALAVVAAAALAAVACTNDRPNVSDPLATKAYGFGLVRDGRGMPTGTVVTRRNFSARNRTRVDSAITLTVSGLDSLSQGDYVVWFGTVDNGTTPTALTSVQRVTGTLVITRTDTTINSLGDPVPSVTTTTTTGVSAFRNGGSREQLAFTFIPPNLLSSADQSTKVVFVTIEPNAATATQPSDVRPIFARLADRTEANSIIVTPGGPSTSRDTIVVSTAQLRFGRFDVKRDSQYVFVVNGRGRAAVFGDRFFLFDSTLSRPPRGYYYAVYGVRRDTVTNAVKDTVFLGELAAPLSAVGASLKSLRQADSLEVDPVVQKRPPSINAGYVEARGDTLSATQSLGERYFRQFAEILVTLEPKLSRPNAASNHIVLSATVPDVVKFSRP